MRGFLKEKGSESSRWGEPSGLGRGILAIGFRIRMCWGNEENPWILKPTLMGDRLFYPFESLYDGDRLGQPNSLSQSLKSQTSHLPNGSLLFLNPEKMWYNLVV